MSTFSPQIWSFRENSTNNEYVKRVAIQNSMNDNKK